MTTDRSGLRPTGPTRTCVGCRTPDSWSVLVRVVADPDHRAEHNPVAVVPDPRRRLPGRGAWLHPDTECFEWAVRRRAFARALRISSPVDTTAVHAHLVALAPEKTTVGADPQGGSTL